MNLNEAMKTLKNRHVSNIKKKPLICSEYFLNTG